MTFQRNLIALQDLLLGTGTAVQRRGNSDVTVTKVNAANFPYNETLTLQQKIDSLDSTHYVDGDNLPVYIATPISASNLNLTDVIWVKTISSTERHVYYYDKVMFKYNPASGDLILNSSLFNTAKAELTADFIAADVEVVSDLTTLINAVSAALNATKLALQSEMHASDTASIATLDLGTASRLDAGTSALNVVQLDSAAKLPAVDASQLTNLPAATAAVGSVVQRQYAESTAVTSYSNLIPRAGSAPANTVGTELLSITITPKAANNKLLIRFQGNAHPSAVGVAPAALLFVDGVFKKGAYVRSVDNSATYPMSLLLETEIVAADTDPIVISIRVGPSIVAGSIKFNDNSWGATGENASLVIEEAKA